MPVSNTQTPECPNCGDEYEGWHDCPEGRDRVEYVCIDCKEHIDREKHYNGFDIDGLVPQRCASCTLHRMAQS